MSLNNWRDALREVWATSGPPRTVYAKTGPFAKLLEKNVPIDAGEWQGTDTIKVPVTASLQGNGGANFAAVHQLSGSSKVTTFDLPLARYMFQLSYTDTSRRLGTPAGTIGGGAARHQLAMEDTANAWWRGFSSVALGDGSGILARGDGAWTVTGDTVTFKNASCTHFFEKGDVLVALEPSPTLDAYGMPIPRKSGAALYTVTVKTVNTSEGSLTMEEPDISAAITGVTNSDGWGKRASYQGAGVSDPYGFDEKEFLPLPLGVLSWIPTTLTKAKTVFGGQDRSADPDRLSGRRVRVSPSDSPWDVFSSMMVQAQTHGLEITDVIVPVAYIAELQAEASSRNYAMRPVETLTNMAALQIGVNAVQISGFGMNARVHPDPYLCDIEVSASDDRMMIGLTLDTWKFKTIPGGIGWRDFAGGNRSYQAANSDEVFEKYQAEGQLICLAASHNIIAGARALD